MNDGTLLELDTRSRTEAGPFWTGSYEPDFQAILTAVVDVYGPSFYDVGANVGLISIPLARHTGESGRVAAFEPVPENAERLRANIKTNSLENITVLETALGKEDGTVSIKREDSYGAKTGNAVLDTNLMHSRSYGAIRNVPMTTLDAAVARNKLAAPHVIKLDIEGSEVAFLAGGQLTLTRYRPVILGEFNSGFMPMFGTTFLDAVALLPQGYEVFSFISSTEIVLREPAVGLGDVLLVPSEKVHRLPFHVRS